MLKLLLIFIFLIETLKSEFIFNPKPISQVNLKKSNITVAYYFDLA